MLLGKLKNTQKYINIKSESLAHLSLQVELLPHWAVDMAHPGQEP